MDDDLGIVELLEFFGLEGFPLFLAAAGVSIVILYLAYLMATRPFPGRKRNAK